MTDLFSRFSKIANLILLQTTIVVAIGFKNQVQAQVQLTSESGNLIVQLLRSGRDACATGKPTASYSIKGSASGLLYSDDCNYPPELKPDTDWYEFVDTSGVERCRGKVTLTFASGRSGKHQATMQWEVLGSVSGYRCSIVGESYEYRMY